MRILHKQKVKIAQRLRTAQEISDKVGIFDSDGWIDRKKAISKRVMREQGSKVLVVKPLPDKILELNPVEVKVVPLTRWQKIKNWFKKLWKSF